MDSYQFTNIKSDVQEQEILRLEQQARIFWSNELALLNRLNLLKATTATDIGCGPGFVTARFAQTFPKINVSGIDISKELILYAQKNHSQH